MKKIKVLSVFGTRPEAIKMSPLIKELEENIIFESIVCVTGQHREMLDSVLDIFNIKPNYDLNIMTHNQTLIDISNNVLKGVENIIKEIHPDIVLVHGDTSTTLNGALAAFYNKIPIGHIEAGLRSYNMYSPFPEEVNRKLTGAIATLHFAPTEKNKKNLIKEGIENNIYVTGNTAIDALLSVVNKNHRFNENILNDIEFDNNKVILLTSHRRENLGEPMKKSFLAIRKIVEKNENIKVIFPMHKNELVRKLAKDIFNNVKDKIILIEPIGYLDFINLMSKCYLIITDSGGIQEEAPSLGKPVIVIRNETERIEGIEAGTVKLAGTESENIFNICNDLINDEVLYKKMSEAKNPYGCGNSSKIIINKIIEFFDK
ncbi:MAG: non-hydrolyzing UDP-N-acetylglucosamine 2-epimerase [Clostridium sp.]|uniref:non-hydrolyzing UDP-N-acetylglucosamine 2-epimerase n=1 Tax=Clostridium sp. TaxID=1506 RepID=UPI00399A12E6